MAMRGENGPNGPNGAISLKQTFNFILKHICNRQYFGVQKAKNGDRRTIVYSAALRLYDKKQKTGIEEQSCIVQP